MGKNIQEKYWNETRIWKEIISHWASKTEWEKTEQIREKKQFKDEFKTAMRYNFIGEGQFQKA